MLVAVVVSSSAVILIQQIEFYAQNMMVHIALLVPMLQSLVLAIIIMAFWKKDPAKKYIVSSICDNNIDTLLYNMFQLFCLGGLQDSITRSYLCPKGYYCELDSNQHDCPRGYYCPSGSAHPYPCTFGTLTCPHENTATPNPYSGR